MTKNKKDIDNKNRLNRQLCDVIGDDNISEKIKLKKIKYLIYLGADVNDKKYGKSALTLAVEKGGMKEIEKFLKNEGGKERVVSSAEACVLAKQI